MIRYNVYGYAGCKACIETDRTLSNKPNIEYNNYDLNDNNNLKTLHQLYPAFKNDPSTPVIQKCTIDDKGNITDCKITQGFREQDYE